ncbi:MAG: transcription antitermination factor NusB [Bdellovibrionales bacterium]
MEKDLSKRRQARELALQILFQGEFLESIDVDNSLDFFKVALETNNETYVYAKHLCMGVIENKETIDSTIQSHSSNWKLHRMAMVDLNILRISTFEILFSSDQVPPKSSIDEAVDLAKKYSTQESSKFINGVLDQVLKNA